MGDNFFSKAECFDALRGFLQMFSSCLIRTLAFRSATHFCEPYVLELVLVFFIMLHTQFGLYSVVLVKFIWKCNVLNCWGEPYLYVLFIIFMLPIIVI